MATWKKLSLWNGTLFPSRLVMMDASVVASFARSEGRVSPLWLIGSYTLLSTAGCAFLRSVSLSSAKPPPTKFAGFLMGSWMAAIALGNLATGFLGILWERWNHSTFFAFLTGLSALADSASVGHSAVVSTACLGGTMSNRPHERCPTVEPSPFAQERSRTDHTLSNHANDGASGRSGDSELWRCMRLYLDRMDAETLSNALQEQFPASLHTSLYRDRHALAAHQPAKTRTSVWPEQGYLSRLRAGAGNPSPELVSPALLCQDPEGDSQSWSASGPCLTKTGFHFTLTAVPKAATVNSPNGGNIMNRKIDSVVKQQSSRGTESAAESVSAPTLQSLYEKSKQKEESWAWGPYAEGESRFRLKIAENGVERKSQVLDAGRGRKREGGTAAEICQDNAKDCC